MDGKLRELRDKIDEIDTALVKLLNERAVVSLQIGEKKQDENLPVYNARREKEVINKVQQKNSGPLNEKNIESIFKIIIESCRTLQEKEI